VGPLGRLTRTPRDQNEPLAVTASQSLLPPADQPRLFSSLQGRLVIVFGALFLIIRGVELFVDLPMAADVLRKIVSVGLIASGAWFVMSGGINRNWRRLVWPVRRKLILAYLLLGLFDLFSKWQTSLHFTCD